MKYLGVYFNHSKQQLNELLIVILKININNKYNKKRGGEMQRGRFPKIGGMVVGVRILPFISFALCIPI